MTPEGLCTACSTEPCSEHRTVTRLVCGNCGAFLPANISPETHADWLCRCGEDWWVASKAFPVRRVRQQRFDMKPEATR